MAGPVTAGAVVLSKDFPTYILNDSKKLTAEAREALTRLILRQATAASLGWASPGEIDTLNIHHATLLAMKRAVESLPVSPPLILVDGIHVPEFSGNIKTAVKPVVKGDSYVPQIQAASILAKTARDRWMVRYSWIETQYQFERHKGYPTKAHRECCLKYGLSPIHRKSFTIFKKSDNT